MTSSDGTQTRYGCNDDSRIEAIGKNGAVRHWTMDTVTDTNGNYFRVFYNKDTENGDYYPNKVVYTFNVSGGINGYRTVKFNWELRPDIRTSYGEGVKEQVDQRLESIEVLIGSTATGDNGLLLNKYKLSYELMDGKSMLNEITACGTDGVTCLSPTRFTYKNLNLGFGSEENWGSGIGPDIERTLGTSSGASSSYMKLTDINGDGLKDHVYKAAGQYLKWSVRLNNGNGFNSITQWGETPGHDYISHTSKSNSQPWQVGYDLLDINGDGLLDAIRAEGTYGSSAFRCCLNNGSSFDPVYTRWDAPRPTRIREGIPSGKNIYQDLIDMNGDGLVDHVYRNGGAYGVALNSEGKFGQVLNWGTAQGDYIQSRPVNNWISHALVDMNGDNLPDSVMRAGANDFLVQLNSGSGFDSEILNWGPGIGSYITADSPAQNIQLRDVNGDGLPDHIFFNESSVTVRLNTGYSMGSELSYPALESHPFSTDVVNYNSYVKSVVTDITGDGLPDIVRRTNSEPFSIRKNQGGAAYRLASVTLPTGGSLSFDYEPASKFDNTDPNGVHRLSFPMWVVTRITTDDGLGESTSSSTTTFWYKGGCYVDVEKEFRGFHQVKETNPNGAYTITYFNQDDDRYGTVSAVEYYDNSANLVNKVENGYDAIDSPLLPPNSGVRFVSLTSEQTSIYDGHTTPYTTRTLYSYDNFGNVTNTDFQGDISISGDESLKVVDYINDTNLWIIGVPKQESTFGYNASGTWEKRRENVYYYDNQPLGSITVGNVTKTESWLDNPTPTSWVTIAVNGYDNYGNVIWTKDANANHSGATNSNGHTADMSYDSVYQTYAESATDAMDNTVVTAFDTLMRPISVADINGQTVTTEYDTFSRPIKVIGPNDTATHPTVQTTFFVDGIAPEYTLTQTREVSGQSGTLDSYEFIGGLGNVIQTKSEGAVAGEWITVDRFTDSVANTSAVTIPYLTMAILTPRDSSQNQTTTTTNSAGTVVTITSTDGTQVTTTRDRNITTVTNALGQQKTTVKDAYGRVVSVTENDGSQDIVATYIYHTATGELLEITEPKGTTITFEFDSLGQKISMTDPDLGTWTYTYDANGNIRTQTDARGMMTTMVYDALNRLIQKNSDASDNLIFTYTYGNDAVQNNVGRLINLTGTENSVTLFSRTSTYDNLGRTNSTTLNMDGYSWTTSSTYDALNRVVTTTLPDGEVISNTYDARGNHTRMTGDDIYLDDASYLTSGAIDSIDYGNNTTIAYTYDDSGSSPSYRLTNVNVTGGSVNMNLGYQYDAIGNIVGITDAVAGKNQTFTYDGINRLITANGVYGAKTIQYDKAGNILSKDGDPYSYLPNSNRLDVEGIWAYTYDANGNVISRNDTSITQDFDYDSLNRLTSFDDGTNWDHYEYDDDENRLKKVEDGKTTYYISGAYEEVYIGPTLDETIKRYGSYAIRDNEGLKYRYSDHLGSSARTADITGDQIRAIWHTPFGDETASTGTASVKYKYTGKEEDLSGLYYYGARYYDPGLGRFMSADSIIPNLYDSQGLNRYAYARNNPIGINDPTGHFWNFVAGGIMTAVAVTIDVLQVFDVIPDDNLAINIVKEGLYGVGGVLLPGAGNAAKIVVKAVKPAIKLSKQTVADLNFVSNTAANMATNYVRDEFTGDSSTDSNSAAGSSVAITPGPSSSSGDITHLGEFSHPQVHPSVDIAALLGPVIDAIAGDAKESETAPGKYISKSSSRISYNSENNWANPGFAMGKPGGARRFNDRRRKTYSLRKSAAELASKPWSHQGAINGSKFIKCSGPACPGGPMDQAARIRSIFNGIGWGKSSCSGPACRGGEYHFQRWKKKFCASPEGSKYSWGCNY